jgi:hypothetical protein
MYSTVVPHLIPPDFSMNLLGRIFGGNSRGRARLQLHHLTFFGLLPPNPYFLRKPTIVRIKPTEIGTGKKMLRRWSGHHHNMSARDFSMLFGQIGIAHNTDGVINYSD